MPEISSELQDLYQELVIDHSRRPHNFRAMADATSHADGYNPLCGDKVTVFLKMEGDRIVSASFQGSGCAISTSSASLLTDALKGKTREEAEALFTDVHKLVTEGPRGGEAERLGKLAHFTRAGYFDTPENTASFPSRSASPPRGPSVTSL